MAEYYFVELSQKVRRGINESLLKGNFIGGMGLFGYDILDKKWTINSHEASIVRDMFERYKNGEKAKDIITRLNESGARTKIGSQFNMNAFARIIRNEKYIGKVTHNGTIYTDIVPAIIDRETFEECNRIMDEHKHKQREVYLEKPYILSGKLYCGYCNSLMTAETGTSKTGRVYHYYKCFNQKRNKDKCAKKPYSQNELEDFVFGKTVEYVLQPNVISQIAKMVVDKFNSEITKTDVLVALENDLKETEKSIAAIMRAIEQGIITKTTQARLLQLEARKEEVEIKISVERSRSVKPLSLEQVKSFLEYFARKEYDNNEEKNEFFNSFINRVILFNDKVIILYNTGSDEKIKIDNSDVITAAHTKSKSSEHEFKRLALGGEGGI